jgi:amino acid transporter
LWERARPLCARPSFSHVATVVADAHPWHSYYESLQFSAWDVFLKGNWSPITFVTDYFPIVFFPVLYVAAKLVMGVHIVKADEMDFVTHVADFDAMTYDDPPPKNSLEAFCVWLV